MLPPGHVAGGFLAGYALLKVLKPDLSPVQINNLLYWAMFFGFAPDLDWFLAFAREKSLTVRNVEKNNHRKFLSHAPILWLIAGLLVYFLSSSVYWKAFGLVVWVGSWSHFIIDTFEYGIMWLWPLNRKKYYIKRIEVVKITEPGFWRYWIKFVTIYTKSLSFYLEIIFILTALIIYFRF